jgi:hypothetical protein
MMPWTVASPKPVPVPMGLVVKNGSKMRARVRLVHVTSRVELAPQIFYAPVNVAIRLWHRKITARASCAGDDSRPLSG